MSQDQFNKNEKFPRFQPNRDENKKGGPKFSNYWIWAILFYLDLFMLFVSLLGAAIDDAGNFTWSQFYNSIVNEEGGITAIVILIGSLLLFRWLALRNYKKNAHLQIPGHA